MDIHTFGESHGPAIGVLIEGIMPNLDFPYDEMRQALQSRFPKTQGTTARIEPENIEVLSGVFEGKTTGMPLCIIIRNQANVSSDYDALKDVFRPGHADFAWFHKYKIHDHRGGGRSGGRETASRIIAATILKPLLGNIRILYNTIRVGAFESSYHDDYTQPDKSNPHCWNNPDNYPDLLKYISEVKANGDSVGGEIRIRIVNVPCGLGDPVYDKLNANLAKALFSIPSVKGVSFGDGETLGRMLGSESNDSPTPMGFSSNHLGGINGGVSTGQDIIINVIIRAVPSIRKPQNSITKGAEETVISIQGRHDSCHIPRIIPVLDATISLALVDAMQHQKLVSGDTQSMFDLREAIDKLDEDLIQILSRRKRMVEKVKHFKEKNGLKPKDEKRELKILEKSTNLAREHHLNIQSVREIMRQVLDLCQK